MNETVLDSYNSPSFLLPLNPDSSHVEHHAFPQMSLSKFQRVQALINYTTGHLNWKYSLSTFALCTIVYVGYLVIYRLYLTPLAAIPGPFLAKVSHWYEFYYDFVHTGKYYERIREMHDKYGQSCRYFGSELETSV